MRSTLSVLLAASACLVAPAYAADIKPMFCTLDHVDGTPAYVLFTEIFDADTSEFAELGYASQFESSMRHEGRKVHGEATCHPGDTREKVEAEMQLHFQIAGSARKGTETVAWRPSAAGAALARLDRAPPQWLVVECNLFNPDSRIDLLDDGGLAFVFRDGEPGGANGSSRALRVRAFRPDGSEQTYSATATIERDQWQTAYNVPGLLDRLLADFPDGALLDVVDPERGNVLLETDLRGIAPTAAEIRACR